MTEMPFILSAAAFKPNPQSAAQWNNHGEGTKL